MPVTPNLYSRDANGRIRVWWAEWEADRWRVHHGLWWGDEENPQSPVTTTSEWTLCTPTNVGRKNERNAAQQAEFEANAEYAKKLARGYVTDPDKVDDRTIFDPMLAHVFADRKKGIKIESGVYTQPKLDGIRCIIRADGAWTRDGQPILSIDHILTDLAPFFSLRPNLIFDGELYNHDLRDDFNTIVSTVKKTKISDAERAAAQSLIQYHIYDLPSEPGSFSRRFGFLEGFYYHIPKEFIRLVETRFVTSWEDLDECYASYLEDGYEGQMVRLDAAYENKRSKHLLKRKEFIDQEFPLVAIEEGKGNWSGYAKRVVCRLPDGRTFGAGIKGTQEALMRVWLNAHEYTIGAEATIRFVGYTPAGIPRFPVAVMLFRDGRDL